MSKMFWRIWAVVFVLSISWLGWCIKSSTSAEAQDGVAEVIKAKQFQVVDDNGNLLATLGLDSEEGTPGLQFYDAQGGLHSFLTVLPEGGGVLSYLLGPQGRGRLRFYVSDDGAASIYINGDHLNPRAVLDVLADGRPRLGLMDADGNVRFDLTVNDDGTPSLVLRDAEHNPRISLGVRDDGSWGVDVKDDEGEPLFSAP